MDELPKMTDHTLKSYINHLMRYCNSYNGEEDEAAADRLSILMDEAYKRGLS